MQNRIVFKIISTGLNFLISIAIGILVPRAIGPSSYGDFSYIISTYGFLFQLLMLSSSVAYVYFLSHGKYKTEDINILYFLFLLIISILVVIILHFEPALCIALIAVGRSCLTCSGIT